VSAPVGPRRAADGPDLARWASVVAELPWASPPEPLWEPGPRQGRWFGSGRLNAATACVGRHARTRPDAVAIVWEGEPGDRRTITYAALAAEVTALARGLAGIGVHSGDVVALHRDNCPRPLSR
jgi:acetyl-CoA synthetase